MKSKKMFLSLVAIIFSIFIGYKFNLSKIVYIMI